MTPSQARAARALLDMTQPSLADLAGLGLSTIVDFEKQRRKLPISTVAAIRAADEQHDAVLPVSVARARAEVTPVPLERVREILDDEKWPRRGESWRPISDEEYQALLSAMRA